MSMKTVPCQYCKVPQVPAKMFFHVQYECLKRPGAVKGK